MKIIYLFIPASCMVCFMVSSCGDKSKSTATTINTPPQASFTVEPSTGFTDTDFLFNASSCDDADDNPSALVVRWDWENDGTWDSDYSTIKTISHRYDSEGIKTIKMEVKDSEGLTDTCHQQVTVTNTVMDIDGHIYKAVKIGNQWWMAENMKVTHYRNGDSISKVTNEMEWTNLSTEAYCAYDNNEGNVDTYGYLYNWYAVGGIRKIAPEGWHVPTDMEWQTLIDYLGGIGIAGGKLKETGTVHWTSPNDFATNESGFTALPSGRAPTSTYTFLRINVSASFWSSVEVGEAASVAWGYSLFNTTHPYLPEITGGAISPWEDDKYLGFSIRCVRD